MCTSDLLEVKLQVVFSCHVGTENCTWVLHQSWVLLTSEPSLQLLVMFGHLLGCELPEQRPLVMLSSLIRNPRHDNHGPLYKHTCIGLVCMNSWHMYLLGASMPAEGLHP